MKKFILVLAVLMLAAPVMAEPNNITITAAVVNSNYPAEVEITYDVTSGKIARAFALDITVTAGTIVDIGNFFEGGECNDSNGYGIFPANFARYINADFNNWDHPGYTPLAVVSDLPGGTQGGIDTNGVTIEMGSLYAAPKGPPENSGTLCSIFVDTDCHVDLALNVGRAGIVMEDGNQPDDVNLVECGVTVVCTVPDVVGDANLIAQLDIFAANFTIGDITTACSVSIADGNAISQSIVGVQTCGTDVDLVVSTGPLASVPDVEDMNGAAAIVAIDAVVGLSVDTVSYACSDTIADGNVISQDPGAGPTCDATVDIAVSTGSCCPAGDITGTVTGYHPPSPFPLPDGTPAYFDVNDWTGSNGQIDTTDVQALNYLIIWMGTDLVVTPVPSAAAGGDVTGTVTGYHPPSPFPLPDGTPAYFDVNDWTGPNGKIDTTDVQALNYLIIWMGTDLVYTCP